jgi:putative FmdB family regulatory protein
MPLYDYECTGCPASFEKLLSIKDRNNKVSCPECKAPATRIISGGNFLLKGNGWSGTFHPVIIPPKSAPRDPTLDRDGYHTQYLNGCTEKSVYDALH